MYVHFSRQHGYSRRVGGLQNATRWKQLDFTYHSILAHEYTTYIFTKSMTTPHLSSMICMMVYSSHLVSFCFGKLGLPLLAQLSANCVAKKSIFAVLAARLEPSRSRVRYGDHDYDPKSWDGDHWRDVSFLFILWCLGLLKPHIWCMVRDTWAVIHCWQFWFSCKHGWNSLYSYPLYNFIIAWSIFMPLRFLDTFWVWHMVSRIFQSFPTCAALCW